MVPLFICSTPYMNLQTWFTTSSPLSNLESTGLFYFVMKTSHTWDNPCYSCECSSSAPHWVGLAKNHVQPSRSYKHTMPSCIQWCHFMSFLSSQKITRPMQTLTEGTTLTQVAAPQTSRPYLPPLVSLPQHVPSVLTEWQLCPVTPNSGFRMCQSHEACTAYFIMAWLLLPSPQHRVLIKA